MQPSRLFNRKPDFVFRAYRPACAGAVEISGCARWSAHHSGASAAESNRLPFSLATVAST